MTEANAIFRSIVAFVRYVLSLIFDYRDKYRVRQGIRQKPMNNECIKTERKQNVNVWTGMQQLLSEKDVYSTSFVSTYSVSRQLNG